MTNSNHILIFLWIFAAIYWLHVGDYSVGNQPDTVLAEVLPKSFLDILDAEPLGLTHSQSLIIQLLAVYIFTWFTLWACFKRHNQHKLTEEYRGLKKSESTGQRVAKIKDTELNQLKAELRQKKEKCLLLEDKFLTGLREERQEQAQNGHAGITVSGLEDKVKRLKAEKDALQNQVKKLEGDVAEKTNSHSGKVVDRQSEIEEENRNLLQKIQEQELVLRGMKYENEFLHHKAASQDRLLDDYCDDNKFLQTKLHKSEAKWKAQLDEEMRYPTVGNQPEEFVEMKEKYQQQIFALERTEHDHWFASVRAGDDLSDLKREMASLRHKITDTYKEIDHYRQSAQQTPTPYADSPTPTQVPPCDAGIPLPQGQSSQNITAPIQSPTAPVIYPQATPSSQTVAASNDYCSNSYPAMAYSSPPMESSQNVAAPVASYSCPPIEADNYATVGYNMPPPADNSYNLPPMEASTPSASQNVAAPKAAELADYNPPAGQATADCFNNLPPMEASSMSISQNTVAPFDCYSSSPMEANYPAMEASNIPTPVSDMMVPAKLQNDAIPISESTADCPNILPPMEASQNIVPAEAACNNTPTGDKMPPQGDCCYNGYYYNNSQAVEASNCATPVNETMSTPAMPENGPPMVPFYSQASSGPIAAPMKANNSPSGHDIIPSAQTNTTPTSEIYSNNTPAPAETYHPIDPFPAPYAYDIYNPQMYNYSAAPSEEIQTPPPTTSDATVPSSKENTYAKEDTNAEMSNSGDNSSSATGDSDHTEKPATRASFWSNEVKKCESLPLEGQYPANDGGLLPMLESLV